MSFVERELYIVPMNEYYAISWVSLACGLHERDSRLLTRRLDGPRSHARDGAGQSKRTID